MVQALSEFGHSESARLLAAERERDPTDQGRLAAIRAEAGRPDLSIKSGWVDRLLSEDAELSLADVRAATRALFPTHQHDLLEQFSDQIFAGLATASRARDPSYFSSYLRGLVRPLCTPRYLSQINAAIGDADSLHPILRRGLLNTRFAVTRCIAIGEYLASGE